MKVEQLIETERQKLNKENESKLDQLREKLQGDLDDQSEEIEKRHAYRLEQMRQEITDTHEQVVSQKWVQDLHIQIFNEEQICQEIAIYGAVMHVGPEVIERVCLHSNVMGCQLYACFYFNWTIWT